MADRTDGGWGRANFPVPTSPSQGGPGGWPEESEPEAPGSIGSGSQGRTASEIARQIGLSMHPNELFARNIPNLAPPPPSMPHSAGLSAPGLFHSQTRAPPQARPLPRFDSLCLLSCSTRSHQAG